MPSLRTALAHVESLQGKISRAKEKTEEAMAHGLQLVEVAGACGLAGYLNTKMGDNGEYQIRGVPADLLAGIGLHALAFLGAAGKYGEHAHNVADGLVAAYAYRAGAAAAAAPSGG